MTACRAARSRPARSTSCCRSRRCPQALVDAASAPRPARGRRGTGRDRPTCCPKSSICCATKTDSRFHAVQARHAAAPDRAAHGAWRRSSRRHGPLSRHLRGDQHELDLLAKDLLINVTSFFRDPKVFDLLAEKVIPDLVRGHGARPAAAHLDRRLQHRRGSLFPGHAVPRAIAASASETSAADLRLRRRSRTPSPAPARALPRDDRGASVAGAARPLLRQGGHGYRVPPELRAAVVFTVQDVLADPPFSRLDLISCRNLLIYLRPEAQAKVISLLPFRAARRRHPAARQLGDGRRRRGPFRAGRQAERLYRHIGQRQAGANSASLERPARRRAIRRPGRSRGASRQAASFAELCRRLVMETYAPAAVLINRKHECLYSLGPTERYLRVAPGPSDATICSPWRARACGPSCGPRSSRPAQDQARVIVAGGQMTREGVPAGRSASRAAGPKRRRGAAAGLLRRRAERPSASASTAAPRRRLRGSPSSSRNSKPPERETAGRDPQPRDLRRRAEGDQRGSPVRQRGISIDQRGTADLEGGIAVAQRGADRAQQPAPGNAGAAAHDLQRSAERPVQHRRRDALPRHRPQHPLLHAGHQVALQCHSRRCRPAARGPQLAGGRWRPSGRRASGAADPGADRAGDRSAERRLVHPPHIALPHPGQRRRGRRHHLCRHHRAEARGGRAGGGQAASGAGQRREIALSRRREP